MQQLPVRRAFAGLVGVAAALALSAAPASAAPETDITMYMPDVTVPVGEGGAQLTPIWWSDEEISVAEPKLVYKLESGLHGVTLEAGDGPGDCVNVTPIELVCTDPFEMGIGPDGSTGFFEASVKADDTAVPYEARGLTATFTGVGVEEVVAFVRVRLAAAVDLTAGPSVEAEGAPGEEFTAPLAVHNSGDKAIVGVSVLFYNDWAIEPTGSFSNCLYSEGVLRSCTFAEDRVEIDGRYVAEMPFKVRADTLAPGAGSGEVRWLTEAELEDYQSFLERNGVENGTPGTGDALHLQDVASRRYPAFLNADVHPEDNWSSLELKVTGENFADLAAVGSTATGKAGDEVTVTAGVRNVGDAAVDMGRVGSSPAVTAVHAPEGTSFKVIPEICREVEGTDDKVECDFSSYLIRPGDEETYEFKLHLDKVVANATGDVVVNEPCECERFLDDVNLKNNKAAILINKAAAPGGTGGGTGDDDDEPSLPVTGPAGSLTLSGFALLIVGVTARVLARRRRPADVA